VIDPDLRDLPGLRQWGDELRAATSRAEEQRDRPRTRRRIPLRRLGVALAAMFLLVPGAVATRSIWDNPVERVAPLAPQPSTPAVRLAEGRTSDVAWRVGGYDGDGGQRCLQLDEETTTTRRPQGGCGLAQTPAHLTVAIATLSDIRFVIGTVATEVASVEVVVAGGRRVRVDTTDVPDEVRRRAGMRGAFRVYVAPFAGGFAERPPPGVSAYDADGRVVGSVGAR
jgi:hypothetical protein